MAELTRMALFWRAFFLSLLFGTSSASADAEDDAAWAAARAANTPEALYLYLSRFPTGAYVDEAVASLAELGALRGIGPRGQGAGRGPDAPRGLFGLGAGAGAGGSDGDRPRGSRGVYP
jgi:hypothetical protein